RKHVARETASLNRWTLQQALQQLCVLLILRLRSRHALSVEAQLADHFGLGLHPIDFNAQHLFGTPPFCFTPKPRASLDYLQGDFGPEQFHARTRARSMSANIIGRKPDCRWLIPPKDFTRPTLRKRENAIFLRLLKKPPHPQQPAHTIEG